ncbi:MAG: AarF/ABC1/UbiB kinase family protein [Nitrospirae bacterium]|nr:AarF/ABC1/UbiB kinase family protein [Nitrospirota bacterium]
MPLDLLKLRSTYRSVSRVRQIINVFLKYGFGRVIDQIHFQRFIPLRTRLKTFGQWPALKGPAVPERLRMAFAELGPSFIKLAQLLSSRPDLITKPFADEFKKLQDEVPPFPIEEAKRIIEEETKLPINKIFLEFDDKPVAAASIAQVHHATLIDRSDVIVKVQRPNIREQLETDINIMTTVANLLDKYVPESRFFNPTGIVEEFSKTVKKELDFIEEARNCCRFRRNFENSLDVYIPKMYGEFITEKVLVMERIEGARIDNITGIGAMGLDRRELAKIGINAYFKQILEDGFFHADPHPGNIFAMPNGMIGFMDFGIVGRVSPELREIMANTFLALINKDFDKLIDQYIELGLVPEEIDLSVFRKEFKADLTEFLEPLYGLTLREINFAEYMDTVTHLAMKHNMKIPSDLLLINKAMLILENIGMELDPNFDFIAAAEPYASKLITQKVSPSRLYERARKNIEEVGDFVTLFPKQMRQIVRKILKDDIHVKLTHIGLDKFIKDMDRSSNRIAFSMVVSAIILSSAVMHATGVGPKIFGMSILAFLTFGFAFLLGIWLIISIIRSGRL